jgi:RNA polymerase sigma-70 factor (ECF subfamily)
MEQPGLGRPTEQALVDRLRRGDETALGDLYDRYAAFVHGLALRVLRDRGAAEDVTQDVFVAMWQNPHRFDASRGTLRSFLGTLTHRRSVDLVRREEARRRRELRTSMEPQVHPDLADTALRGFASERVRAALAVLPPAQREALELAYFHGRTYRQVADDLGIPEGTAKSRLRLGLQRIAELLRPELSEQWA